MPQPGVAKLFCKEVRDALVQASQVPDIGRQRTIAVENAIAFARRKQPYLFKE
jgi:hypothetical protein